MWEELRGSGRKVRSVAEKQRDKRWNRCQEQRVSCDKDRLSMMWMEGIAGL
jgi:hypothetical protein